MNKRIIVFFAFFIGISLSISAQTINEAGEQFNIGLEKYKAADYGAAIQAYEKVIEISKVLGDEGLELQLKAEQQLPAAYFNYGKAKYQEKNYPEAIDQFNKSAAASKVINDEKTLDACNAYLAGIYTAMGNASLKGEQLPDAMTNFGKALEYKPNYIKAYYGMLLVYKKNDDLANVKATVDKMSGIGPEDDETVIKSKEVAATTFLNAGAKALQAKKYNDAVQNLNISLEYNAAEPKAYYYLALSYNSLSKWDDAIVAANKAIELAYESPSDAQFEVGKALEGKGDKTGACDAYLKVTAGNNVAAAKYQREQVLKCN